jgi:ribonuclease BN (tRNA processing enzyme)
MAVQLTVIGSSPAWPNPGSAQSGYLLRSEGALLLDCGPGVLGRLPERGAEVDAVAITHFHLDHCGDLIPWAWLTAFSPPRRDVLPELWLPPGGLEELHTFAGFWGIPQMWERTFVLHEFEPGSPFDVAGFRVDAHRLPHYTMEAYGFSVAANGKTLAYSGDSAPSPELADLALGADLFLVEATLESGEKDGTPRGHLSAEEALAAADGPVLLTHRPFELPAPDGVPLAYDGLVVQI